MIKAITFDLDMTLIDFMTLKRKGSDAAAKAMVKAGLKMPIAKCKKELFDFYLNDIEGNTVFGEFLKKKNKYSDRILAAGINAYIKEKAKHLKTYPTVRKTLVALKKKGIKIAIVTDAPRLKAYSRLNAIGIDDLFSVIVGHEDTGLFKPDKMPFKKALKLLKVKPSEAMHVGDWPERDVLGARNAGMKTCLAMYGWKNHMLGKWVEPDYKINKLNEVWSVIENAW